MDQHLHFLTIATRNLDATRRFYNDALGWTPLLDVTDEIIFYQIANGLLLGFFDAVKFNQDLGREGTSGPPSGLTLAHNVESPDAVRSLVDTMQAGGGTVLKTPQPGAFGGIFHAHVADPNGVIWEIAHNPNWSIAPDGRVHLG